MGSNQLDKFKDLKNPVYPETRPHVEPVNHFSCKHCYCQTVWINGIAHTKCCNCGHQMVSPITTVTMQC